MKIHTNTPDNYRSQIHFLQDQEAKNYTFQSLSDKSIRVVIKNIHSTTDPMDIATD